MERYPTISIVIPTYNSEKVLPLCLKGISCQNYPRDKVEILFVDAGSNDNTRKIIKEFESSAITEDNWKRIMILDNARKTGEAGKAIGVTQAEGEIIALIDSDNIVEDSSWLMRMVEPFQDPEIIGAEPMYYTYRKDDGLITRYCALIGANDPICMYLGNYDRYNHATGRWTDMPVDIVDKGNYFRIKLNRYALPTIGANGFLIRREALNTTNYKPYFFDLDVVYSLVSCEKNTFAKVKVGIVHLFAGSIRTFLRKQQRRIQDYLYYRKKKMRTYPWQLTTRQRQIKFIFTTLFIIPLLIDIIRGYKKIRDRAWLFHFYACWATFLIYSFYFTRHFVLGKTDIKDRQRWEMD